MGSWWRLANHSMETEFIAHVIDILKDLCYDLISGHVSVGTKWDFCSEYEMWQRVTLLYDEDKGVKLFDSFGKLPKT